MRSSDTVGNVSRTFPKRSRPAFPEAGVLGIKRASFAKSCYGILKGVTTIALGRLLTNCCVESGLRTGYDARYGHGLIDAAAALR